MNYIKVNYMRNLLFISSIFVVLFSSNLYAQPNNLVVGNINSSSVDLSWDASSCSGNITLHYKIAGTSWPGTIINNVTSPYNLSNLISSTNYEWRVKCAGSGNPWSPISNFTTLCSGIFGCTDMFACNYNALATCDDSSCFYSNLTISSFDTSCNSYSWYNNTYTQSGVYTHPVFAVPSSTVSSLLYCSSNPNINFIAQDATIIENVQLTGDNFNIINNTSGSNDFYEDYTATMYADITEGQTYTINVIPDDLSPSGSYAPEAINVYIDFNIDGDFDDLDEDLGVINIPWGTWASGSVYSFNVTVPSTGVYGATRMRVVTMSNAEEE